MLSMKISAKLPIKTRQTIKEIANQLPMSKQLSIRDTLKDGKAGYNIVIQNSDSFMKIKKEIDSSKSVISQNGGFPSADMLIQGAKSLVEAYRNKAELSKKVSPNNTEHIVSGFLSKPKTFLNQVN